MLPTRTASLAGVGLFICLISSANIPAFGQAAQVSLQELAQASSDVVVGAVSGKQSFWEGNRSRIFTEIRLKVSERVKGDAPDETVVIVPGGQIGNTLYEVSDMPVFIEGEEVLVFLWREPSGRHVVTGAANGKLRVVKDDRGARILDSGAEMLLQSIPDDAEDAEDDEAPARGESQRIRVDEFVQAVKRLER